VTRRRWALAAATCAVLLAACSTSSPHQAERTSTTQRAAATSTSTTAPATSSTTSTTTAPVTAACNHVSATAGPSQGAAGTITGTVVVTNTGSATCTANGYPTIGLFSGSGAPLAVTMVDGLSVSLSPPANAAPAPVALAPSAAAQFAYQISDVPVGSETSCPSSEVAAVTMPGAAAPSARFAFVIAPCDNGTVRVSPLYPGS
jgi:hypothetical protein